MVGASDVVAVVEPGVLEGDELTVEADVLELVEGRISFGLPDEVEEPQPSITTPATEISATVRRASALMVLPFGAAATAIPTAVGFVHHPTQFAKAESVSPRRPRGAEQSRSMTDPLPVSGAPSVPSC